MKPKVTLRHALHDPALLGAILPGASWAAWRAMLLAVMGERLEPLELEIFRRFTGRKQSPSQRVAEAWFAIGRRGGKDRAASVLTSYVAALCDHGDVLAPGERGVVLCVGADRHQATVQLNYISGVFESSPIMSQMVAGRTADALSLTNGIEIEVRSASFRRLRGMTAVAVVATECAWWHSDETNSANPDAEILNAIRPALATTSGPLIVISSPYARRGALWEICKKNYGSQGDPLILVAQGASRDFNPTLPQAVIDRALERDYASASAEYLAQFRADIESFVAREAVEACVAPGVREHPPLPRRKYFGFVDPSGGSNDSMTMAIAHEDDERAVVVDVVREIRPPFSPETAVQEFAETLWHYGVKNVEGDRYAGEWPREQFRKRDITYTPASVTKSDLYRELLPLINTRKIVLLDNPRLVSQIANLERRVSRGGRDSIDHPPNAHDDLANAVAGAAYIVSTAARRGEVSVGYAGDGVGRIQWKQQERTQIRRVNIPEQIVKW